MEKEWPIYEKENLATGNLESNVGLCTLWSEKEIILKKVSSANYLVAGQCYGKEVGLSLIIRNTLANKKLKYLVINGSDLDDTGNALMTLKERGVNSDKKIPGFEDYYIEKEIPLEAVERFVKNVEIIDKRNVRDYGALNNFLSNLPKTKPWGDPEIYPRPPPIPPDYYPSEETGFIARGEKVGDVWREAIHKVFRFGQIKPSEYGKDQKQQELAGLITIITNEDPRNIDWKPYFKFSKEHFEKYLPQLMTSDIIGDVRYTYGSRLRDFNGINQIDAMVEQLSKAFFSRRAVAVLWDVEKDYNNSHSPCLNLIQCLGQDKMHMTAVIRSNDMFKAWPENALALRNIQYEIAEKIEKKTGNKVPVGSLMIFSDSAHIYSNDWKNARKLLEEYPVLLTKEPDPRGNILINLRENKIRITHLNPKGRPIGEFYVESAKEGKTKIAETEMISQISHALDIGAELGKAEIALKNNLDYVQDKPLKTKKTI